MNRFAPVAPAREFRVVSSAGTPLHVEVHGPEGAPTVVLSHGWTCSTVFWAPVVRDLAADHRVVLYDQRGHGRSAAPGRDGYSTTALADDLEAVLDAAVDRGERVLLAGHSMGGMTIMAAADRPAVRDRAAAVLLANTGAGSLVAEATVLPLRAGALRHALQKAVLSSALPLGPISAVSRAALKYGTMGPDSAKDAVQACARLVHACPRRVRAGWGRMLAALEVEANLVHLTAPTAVLTSTVDRLTPPVLARRIADALPNCVGVTELPGLGHMTPLEDPDAVVGLLRKLSADHLSAGRPSDDRPRGAAVPRAAASEPVTATAPVAEGENA
ncbi:alpha/beta fold hydrolase [Streptomyces sp. NPDC059506]|uniref:alpha/beta fold hydrolase n=1 Tax=Streptomyces sp. NPDC059506 TaxID=3347751 RepID=UPI00367D0115